MEVCLEGLRIGQRAICVNVGGKFETSKGRERLRCGRKGITATITDFLS
jgi:hypothetical protein